MHSQAKCTCQGWGANIPTGKYASIHVPREHWKDEPRFVDIAKFCPWCGELLKWREAANQEQPE